MIKTVNIRIDLDVDDTRANVSALDEKGLPIILDDEQRVMLGGQAAALLNPRADNALDALPLLLALLGAIRTKISENGHADCLPPNLLRGIDVFMPQGAPPG